MREIVRNTWQHIDNFSLKKSMLKINEDINSHDKNHLSTSIPKLSRFHAKIKPIVPSQVKLYLTKYPSQFISTKYLQQVEPHQLEFFQ